MTWLEPETQAETPCFGGYSTTVASPAADSVAAMLRQIMAEMAEMRADIAEIKAAMTEKRAENPTPLRNTDSSVTALSPTGSVPVPNEKTESTSETDAFTEDGVATPTVSVAEDEPLPHPPSNFSEWKGLEVFDRELRRLQASLRDLRPGPVSSTDASRRSLAKANAGRSHCL